MKKWTRALYQPNRPLSENGYVTACADHIALSREAAREGMVLLKNDDHTLPLSDGARIAPIGKGIVDMVKGGGGSGDVNTPFVRTLAEGLEMEGACLYKPLLSFYEEAVSRAYQEGGQPGLIAEPAVPRRLFEDAAAWTDTALLSFSRFSGEGWDRLSVPYDDPDQCDPWEDAMTAQTLSDKLYPESDFSLTDDEKALVDTAANLFKKVIVVLNVGGMVDVSWIRDNTDIQSALLMWQGGMDGGRAAAELLMGKACPCGKLPDTFAASLQDYPSTAGFHESADYVAYTEDVYVGYRYFETIPDAAGKVVYPFGYGLSYTSFEVALTSFEVQDTPDDPEQSGLHFTVQVTNTGSMAGKEAVGIYYSAPQGYLGRPARELGTFAKTPLLAPGESTLLQLTIPVRQLAAFDDLGRIKQYALVLEKGSYRFYLGSNVRSAALMEEYWDVPENRIIAQLSGALSPNALKQRLRSDGSFEPLPTGPIPDLNACLFEKMIPGSEEGIYAAVRGRKSYTPRHPYKDGIRPLIEVAEGRMSEDDFLKQLPDNDLITLLGGTGNTGVANVCGFGGLPDYGIPAVMTSDGPAGIRISPECGVETTAWPCATALSSTWDQDLIRRVGKAAGEELKENNLQIWLAPAMNIHRSPLCGRNFEYYSEDPCLSGHIAAAMVSGVQSNGVAACIKHFACNNKETNRKHSDSRVSLRALREIYLRGFEIAVRESDPWVIMSAYNAINGQRTSESRDLLTVILRDEWGFGGVVTTDWWTRGEQYKEILAGNDVKMACGFEDRVKRAMDLGALTRDDLLACAKRIIHLICRLD